MNTSKIKLGIIGCAGVPANYGGFETLAHHLVLQLNRQMDMTVYSSSRYYKKSERVNEWHGAKVKYLPFNANGIQSIFYDISSMIHAIIFCDVLLILGVSGCLFLPFIRLFTTKHVIVNVDGLEWRRSKWNLLAKWFLILSEQVAIWSADEVVADNAAIQKYILDHYGVRAHLIEYGADHNHKVPLNEENENDYPFLKQAYAFKVARIEPENNIHLILEAFSHYKDLPLVIVGNWDRSDYGKNLRTQYRAFENLHLLDPVYDPKTLNLLRSNAQLYVHGHSAGGTNPSLVEAMYLGLPILSYGAIYNRITTENKAYYFDDAKQLQSLLPTLMGAKGCACGISMQRIARRRYRWSEIAHKYYRIACNEAPQLYPVFNFELPASLRRSPFLGIALRERA